LAILTSFLFFTLATALVQAVPRNGPIEGIVFSDTNGNGVRDDGEPPLAAIGVSDGCDVVRTDQSGRYKLPHAGGEARFVFVAVPSGYRKGGRYWRRLEASETPRSYDFALVPAARTGDRFSFVHLGDTHIGRKGGEARLKRVLDEIGRIEDPPRFIVVTGDLVDDGRIAQSYVNYLGVVGASPVPVLPVPGNHDVLADPKNFSEFLGPEYYSFDEGRFHFVVMTCFDTTSSYERWLQNDRAALATGRPLVLFQHYEIKTDRQFEEFASWGTRLFCHSHWHGNRVVTYKAMTVLSTPTPLFGGIDASPPSFHVVAVDGERLSATRRLTFQERRLSIVSPSDDLVQTGPTLQVIANAYDSSRPPRSARFELKQGGRVVTSGTLSPDGDWSWSRAINTGDFGPGAYEIAVTVSDADQRTWSASKRFRLSAGDAPRPRAGTENWPTFLGNAQRNRRPVAVVRPPLALSWAVPIGPPSEYAAPVLSEGTIYVSLRNRGFPGDNGVLALDALTGARKWFAPTASAVHNSVAVEGDTVYASSVGGRTYAFDARDGREIWHVDHGSAYVRWVYQAPLVLGDKLIAGSAAHISIIDRAAGRELRHTAFNSDWMPAFGSFAASSGTFLACANWAKLGLAAFDLETSKALWGLGVYGCMATPVIADGRIYATDIRGAILCREFPGGEPVWAKLFAPNTYQSPGIVASPAVAGDRLIVAAGKVAALDRGTGDVVWEFPPDPPASGYDHVEINRYFSSPVVSGDLVWIGSGTGYLYALDVKTGRRVARIEFGVPILSTPLLWGNSLYIATYDGHLYCLTAEK
jgi:outer membrane protein assembly factor BamB